MTNQWLAYRTVKTPLSNPLFELGRENKSEDRGDGLQNLGYFAEALHQRHDVLAGQGQSLVAPAEFVFGPSSLGLNVVDPAPDDNRIQN